MYFHRTKTSDVCYILACIVCLAIISKVIFYFIHSKVSIQKFYMWEHMFNWDAKSLYIVYQYMINADNSKGIKIQKLKIYS